jgi:hypothetical protein
MAQLPNAHRRTTQEEETLREHRDFIRYIGGLLSGTEYFRKDQTFVHVYRLPSADNRDRLSLFRETRFGELHEDQNQEVFVSINGDVYYVEPIDHPEDAIDFLNELYHRVHQRKLELELPANETLKGKSKTIPGARGHLVDLYETLIERIRNEHWRQRDRIDEYNQ